MLKKLLKYDLQNIYKVLSIFYMLAIFFSTLTRIFLNFENSYILNIIGKVCSGITISMIANILINNLMGVWVRLKHNFYGDESYLTHTLPISKKTLYLSKFLSSIITLFISVLVITITLFIAYYSKDLIQSIKNILLPIATAYDSTIIKIILAFIFIVFLEIANGMHAGYTGIILGHNMNNNKVGYSVLYGLITYILTQIFIILIVFINGLFNSDIMNLFYTTDMITVGIIKYLITLAIIVYLTTIIIIYFINIRIFNKGVNID
ncbi:MAG: hypothetical protein IJZ79_05410 [Bacilli bacterium]|nr:hypothetical protein [Bacilli bacterium]